MKISQLQEDTDTIRIDLENDECEKYCVFAEYRETINKQVVDPKKQIFLNVESVNYPEPTCAPYLPYYLRNVDYNIVWIPYQIKFFNVTYKGGYETLEKSLRDARAFFEELREERTRTEQKKDPQT